MSGEGLVILVPVLNRPQRVAPLIENVAGATPGARVLFIPDPTDALEISAIKDAGGWMLPKGGNYARKINYGVAMTDSPLVFTGADDLVFHDGWLEAALRPMLNEGAQVVGTQDLCNPRTIAGRHATHFLVRREYAELPTIDDGRGPLCEKYAHNAVDDELIATAKHRGVYAFAGDSIVEHQHPLNETAPMDDTYKKALSTVKSDKRLFNHRCHLWT